jgi:hypothetical protein
MSAIPDLTTLAFIAYIDTAGQLPDQFEGQIGVYAIFDASEILQYIGYSRNVSQSLRQHLVRCPEQCHWVKVHTLDKPNRSTLETIRDTWIQANGTLPAGNGPDQVQWTQPISVQAFISPEEKAALEQVMPDEVAVTKLRKTLARQVEATLLERLKARGLQVELRFNPKLKADGLLDLA